MLAAWAWGEGLSLALLILWVLGDPCLFDPRLFAACAAVSLGISRGRQRIN